MNLKLGCLIISSFLFSLSLQANDLFDLESPQFIDDQLILESNDAGQTLTVSEDDYWELTGLRFHQHLANYLNFKKSFSSVAPYIIKKIEDKFDIFIIVNVDHESRFNKNHEIPSQRMKILRKTKARQKVFVRDGRGVVIGIRKDVIGNNGQGAFPHLSHLMKVSSGASHLSSSYDVYDDTPTGIYRVNDFLSARQRYSYTESDKKSGKVNPTPVMFNSLFFDLVYPPTPDYPKGQTSGIALHGTNKSQYKHLGRQRSHGCIRITQAQSNSLYENLIVGRDFWGRSPKLNNKKRLKSASGGSKQGPKAIFIIFYGYDPARESWDI